MRRGGRLRRVPVIRLSEIPVVVDEERLGPVERRADQVSRPKLWRYDNLSAQERLIERYRGDPYGLAEEREEREAERAAWEAARPDPRVVWQAWRGK